MDDCRPLREPDERILDLSNHSSLYGYIRVVRSGGYSVPIDCAMRVIAPEGYLLTIRIPRVEIPFRPCTYDNMTVIGNSGASKYICME